LLGNNNLLGEQIINKLLDYSDLTIDDYSKIIGPTIFMDESLNLGAKSIVNGKEGNYSIRGIIDFFGSIILKPINIPNASSSILGKFIYDYQKILRFIIISKEDLLINYHLYLKKKS